MIKRDCVLMLIQSILQGFIVASPQLANTGGLIASLGRQYPPGTSFTIVPGKTRQNHPIGEYIVNKKLYWKFKWLCQFFKTSYLSFTAGQQQVFQQVSTGSEMSGAVHRPQVQRISNNIVTLSNVKSPPLFGPQTTIQPVHSVNTVVSKTGKLYFYSHSGLMLVSIKIINVFSWV